jgi:hypothetical protein
MNSFTQEIKHDDSHPSRRPWSAARLYCSRGRSQFRADNVGIAISQIPAWAGYSRFGLTMFSVEHMEKKSTWYSSKTFRRFLIQTWWTIYNEIGAWFLPFPLYVRRPSEGEHRERPLCGIFPSSITFNEVPIGWLLHLRSAIPGTHLPNRKYPIVADDDMYSGPILSRPKWLPGLWLHPNCCEVSCGNFFYPPRETLDSCQSLAKNRKRNRQFVYGTFECNTKYIEKSC